VIKQSGQAETWGIDTGYTPAYVVVDLSTGASMNAIFGWYKSQLLAKGWQLRSTSAYVNTYMFTRGDREVFLVAYKGAEAGEPTYSIKYGLMPAPCATTPPPTALANCG
jgi:hypothetical protein